MNILITAECKYQEVFVSLLSKSTATIFQSTKCLQFVFLTMWRSCRFVPWKDDPEEDYDYQSFENSAVFYSSSYQYIILAIVFAKGKPYRNPIYSNSKLVYTFIWTFYLFHLLHQLIRRSVLHSIHHLIFWVLLFFFQQKISRLCSNKLRFYNLFLSIYLNTWNVEIICNNRQVLYFTNHYVSVILIGFLFFLHFSSIFIKPSRLFWCYRMVKSLPNRWSCRVFRG